MAIGKFDPNLFFQLADNVAIYVSASEIFGMLSRSFDLPAQWAAITTCTTGEHKITKPGAVVEAADAEEVLFARTTPVEVTLLEDGIVTKDRYQGRAEVGLRLVLIPEKSELLSFQRTVLGSHRVVQAKGLARHLQPTVRVALAKFAAKHRAADVVESGLTDAMCDALTEALQGPCFEAGLSLDAAPTVRFDSQTLRQVQLAQQDATRRSAEHAAGRQVQEVLEHAQSEHLDHLASLLNRLQGLADGSPEVGLPELIRTFSERERGDLYQAMFAPDATSATTRWIVVAIGDELLYFDPRNLAEPARRSVVEGAAGPARSIQSIRSDNGTTTLLLGASTGVYRWPVDASTPDLTCIVENAASVRGGFNAVAAVGDGMFATHSELGICQWNTSEPNAARSLFESMTQNAQAIRAIQFFDGNLYCAIDDRIIRWPADGALDQPDRIYTGSVATMTAVCPTDGGLFAGNGEGDVLHWPADRDGKPERLHTGAHRAAESVWMRSSHGVRRLIYADTSLHVHTRVLGDSFACRYEAGGQTLRRVEVGPDILVATNDLRDRLICWEPGKPATPSATIAVARICGHSVQDVCLVANS